MTYFSHEVRQAEYFRSGQYVNQYYEKVQAKEVKTRAEKRAKKKMLEKLDNLSKMARTNPDHVFAVTLVGIRAIDDFKASVLNSITNLHLTYPGAFSHPATIYRLNSFRNSPYQEVPVLEDGNHFIDVFWHYKFNLRLETLRHALDRELPKDEGLIHDEYMDDIALKSMGLLSKLRLKIQIQREQPNLYENIFEERDVHFYFIQQSQNKTDPSLTVVIVADINKQSPPQPEQGREIEPQKSEIPDALLEGAM